MGSSAITVSESATQQTDNDTISHKTGPDEEYETPWVEPSAGPLWSDFDVVLQEYDDEDELVPETDEVEVQTEKVPTSDQGIMAAPDTEDVLAGTDDDKWKQIYFEELEKWRRQNTADVALQTGVLARVEHLYGKKVMLTSEEEEEKRLVLESNRAGPSGLIRPQTHRLEEYQLKRASSDEQLTREPPRKLGAKRSTSFRKHRSSASERRAQERQATVQDLRNRWEQAKEHAMNQGFPDSSTE